MNKIKIKETPPKAHEINIGDIYLGPHEVEAYIVARVGPGEKDYVAISLQDGDRWTEITDIVAAVDGLEFYKHNATISID